MARRWFACIRLSRVPLFHKHMALLALLRSPVKTTNLYWKFRCIMWSVKLNITICFHAHGIDGCIYGYMDGSVNGYMGGCMDLLMDVWIAFYYVLV